MTQSLSSKATDSREADLDTPVCYFTVISLLAAVAASLIGCATRDAVSNAPRPGDGIAEYRQIVDEGLKAMGAALASLDRVSTQTNRCSARVLAVFSKEVERLEVDSLRVRARSQAMQARGEAYFEHWHETLARVEDPRVRELAAQHRPQLQQSFANIKLASETTRDVFKPFLAGLRRLQTALGFGLDILQEASGNYQEDLAAGRSGTTALRNLCQVLARGSRVWVQELNRVSTRLGVGGP
jgi:hypothetical protein